MTMKAVIVGCGAIADGHADAVGRLPNVRMVAACDREKLMAQQLADRYGIDGVYDDFEQMLDEHKPNAVHITTPPQSHVELGKTALARGCHVYIEKPLTVTGPEARALIDDARRADRVLTVGHIYQFDPPALAMRRLVAEGVMGDLVHMESFFGYNLAGSFGRTIMGSSVHWVHGLPGNLVQNNISHPLAKVLEFITDADPGVTVSSWRRSEHMFGDRRDRVHDELRAIINGATASAYVTFSAGANPQGHFLRIYGTRNTMHLNYVSRTVTLESSPALPSALGRLGPAFSQSWRHFREGGKNVYRFMRHRFHFFAGMHELVRRFYDSVENGTDPPIPYDEILRVADVTDRIIEQVARQKADR
jgi:predicted dehydrogenase